MAKQGMKRPSRTHTQPRNDMPPVPELQSKAKNSGKPANPILSGAGPEQKVIHEERPISSAYAVIDNDLARDNLENDLSDADFQDL